MERSIDQEHLADRSMAWVEIYELLYEDFPNIKDKFFAYNRKRKSRLDPNGKSRRQNRRKSFAMRAAVKTRKARLRAAVSNRQKKSYDFLIKLWGKNVST